MKIDWVAVGKVGIPGVIAMFLVVNIVSGFDKFDKRFQEVETQHTQAAIAQENAKDLAGRALMTSERILWTLQIMCANDAKTADARERCLRDR